MMPSNMQKSEDLEVQVDSIEMRITYSLERPAKTEAGLALGMAMKTVGWCNC